MIYLLNTNRKVVGVLDNSTPLACPYDDDLHLENIATGVNTYEFNMPGNHEMSEKVEIDGYVIITDLDEKQQMFKVKDIQEIGSTGYEKNVFCEHIAIPDLLGSVVRPVTLSSYSLENAIQYILKDTGWALGDCEYETSKDVVFDDFITSLEALYKIMELWGAEVRFETIFKYGEIVRQYIHVIEKRGQETKKIFSYSKDLTEVTRTENSEGLVTALIGVGKGGEDGKRISLFNYVPPTVPDGFDKPAGADWIGNDEALSRFGDGDRHIFGIFVYDTTHVNVLYTKTLEELKKRMIPKLTFTMKVAVLERIAGWEAEKVRVGDTIVVDDYTFNPRLSVMARVIEIKRSYVNPEKDEVVLGDYRPIRLGNYADVEAIQRKISANEGVWELSANVEASYKVEIISTKGIAFQGGTISTVLRAIVYQGSNNITDSLNANQFKWTRVSNDTAADTVWNDAHFGGVKEVTITDADVKQRATFFCEVSV